MFEVTIRKSFSAAHTLDIGGKCEDLHGHNFYVDICVAADELDNEGLVIDFRILKQWADEIIEELDHTFLNDIRHFQDQNPSSERVAEYIYDGMTEKARSRSLKISKVTVWESNTAWATYTGDSSV